MRILTVNCGSSSLKFDVIEVEGRGSDAEKIAEGNVERIGSESKYTLLVGDDRMESRKPVADHAEAFEAAVQALEDAGLSDAIDALGHRVVHGGRHLDQPSVIDESVIAAIENAGELAPLHNLAALAAIRTARTRFQATPMVATFDTAFYASMPEVASQYALPRDLSERFGIKRFGFHGLAHRYMVERYRELRPDVDQPRVITLQLGSGCSATASLDGRPVDTSMGFSPLEGLIMGTRSGDLDPAVPLFLARQEGLSLHSVEDLLNKQSGLLGLSGRSSDMRDLLQAEASGDRNSALAVEAFCYRIRKYVGAYLSVLAGADTIVFGGGVGEHSPQVRQRICASLSWAGLELDEKANESESQGNRKISSRGSGIEAWVLPVDESSVIAKDVSAVLGH